MDKTFWIGAGVGLISALIGAAINSWLQFKFRMKELSETKKQQQIDQEKEKLSQEEAARNRLMALIGDFRTDREFTDYLRKFIKEQDVTIQDRRTHSIFHSLAYDYYFSDDLLKPMSLPELIGLHITLLNMASWFPISELVNQRENKMEQATNKIIEMLYHIQATSSQSVNLDSDKK